MKSVNIKELMDRLKTRPADVVGVDLGFSGTKAVRVRKSGETLVVVGADILPSIKTAASDNDAAGGVQGPLGLPSNVKGKYVSAVITGEDASIKLLSFPGRFDEAAEEKVAGNLGIEDASAFRIGYKLISEGHGKSESKVLAVGVPEADAGVVLKLFPTGTPAPFSIEIAGLSVMTSFMHGPGASHANDAVAVIDFGTSVTTFCIFNKQILALIRRFDFGINVVREKVQEMLGVDKDTAQGIINDGAFDISQAVSDVMDPVIKQMIISRDFVERRENCHISKLYATGALVSSKNSMDELKVSLGLETGTWNPFDGLTVEPGVIPENLKGQEWRFTAAVGACLATFEVV